MPCMKNGTRSETARHLWGIYHLDREYSRELGDPLRTVIEAATKEDAELEAERVGFYNAWAHPVTTEEAIQAQWLPAKRQLSHATKQEQRATCVRV